jgi:DNA-nicking Smr family endonuclease
LFRIKLCCGDLFDKGGYAMKPRKSSFCFNSFQDIKKLLESKCISFPESAPPEAPEFEFEEHTESEEELFTKAMEGVKPIQRDKWVERIVEFQMPESSKEKEDAEVLLKLKDLVEHGTGFNVSDTPEYIEGTGFDVHPSVAKRLHRGDFSIQAYVDLHGYVVDAAKEIFEKFIRWAVIHGKTGLLIVHGRGLSSPSEPVLKKKVVEWLTRGPWRKWVVAYSSARYCDGGAGATYVLLRKRPMTRRLRRQRSDRPKERDHPL